MKGLNNIFRLYLTLGVCGVLIVLINIAEQSIDYWTETSGGIARQKASLANSILSYEPARDEGRWPYFVFEIDQEFVADGAGGRGWPPTYGQQAAMLADLIVTFQPSVIVWDLYYSQYRPGEGLEALLRRLCRAGGTNCALDHAAGEPRCRAGARPSADQTTILIGSAMFELVDHHARPPGLEALVESCPHLKFVSLLRRWQFSERDDYPIRGASGIDTPAVGVVRALCDKEVRTPVDCEAAIIRLDGLADADGALSLRWAKSRTVHTTYELDGMPCLPDPTPALSAETGPAQECPFAPTVRASALQWRADFAPLDGRLRRFENPVILAGVAIGDGIDSIDSAIIGDTPLTGVFLHAMALDNLLKYGASFKASQLRSGAVGTVVVSSLAGFLALTVLLLFDRWLEDRRSTGFQSVAERAVRLAAPLSKLVLLALLWALFGLVIYYGLNLGVQAWLSISFKSSIVALLLEGQASPYAFPRSRSHA